MDINATLFGQMITFAIFVWFTMKFIWPRIMNALEERRNKIADGLAAAEQGKKELELAHLKSQEILTESKTQAALIIDKAHQRAVHIMEEAKQHAQLEGERLLKAAEGEIDQQYNKVKEELMKQVSAIAVAGAEKILQREIDQASNDHLIRELVGEI